MRLHFVRRMPFVAAALVALASPLAARAQDGMWMDLGGSRPAARWLAGAVYDPIRHRFVVLAGQGANADISAWATPLEPQDAWERLPDWTADYGTCVSVLDEASDRIVTLGRLESSGPSWVSTYDLATQHSAKLAVRTAPGMDEFSSLSAYDPRGRRVIFFGGTTAPGTWVLGLSDTTWTPLPTVGDPPPRPLGSVIYDASRRRFVGYLATAANRRQWWELTLDRPPTWTHLGDDSASSPDAEGLPIALDPVHDRLLAFGSPDMFEASLAGAPSWQRIPMQGSPPPWRRYAQAVYDATLERFALFGGCTYDSGDGLPTFGDLVQASFAGAPTWIPEAPRFPGGDGYAAALDPATGKVWLVGGPVDDAVWEYDTRGILPPGLHRVSVTGSVPYALDGHSGVFDAARQRMLVFGGSPQHLEAWALDLGGTPTWSSIATQGTPPDGRRGHRAVFDGARDRMIVFGGAGITPGEYTIPFYNDVWELSLGATPTWRKLSPSGTPPSPRQLHAMVLDPARDRIIVYGGEGADGVPLADAWSLSLSDPPAWSQLPSGPPGLSGAAAVLDTRNDRILLDGGRSTYGLSSETFALPLIGTPRWSALWDLGPTIFRAGHVNVYDATLDAMFSFAGMRLFDRQDPYHPADPIWVRTSGTIGNLGAPPPSFGAQVSLSPPQPNPSRDEVTLSYVLPRAGRAALTVHDVSGRVVRTLSSGDHPAGVQRVGWDGRDAQGRTVEPGLFLVHLVTADGERTVRLARVR